MLVSVSVVLGGCGQGWNEDGGGSMVEEGGS